MGEAEVAEIARKLTKAQRKMFDRAIAEKSIKGGAHNMSERGAASSVFGRLERMGLVTSFRVERQNVFGRGWDYHARLTDLGRSVASLLKAKGEGSGDHG
jgi:hypothetical protein